MKPPRAGWCRAPSTSASRASTLPVGCLLTVTLLGAIEAEQTEKGRTCRNDQLVAKVSQSRSYADITRLDQLGEGFTGELTAFFVTYNELKGKRFDVKAISDAERACALVDQASRKANTAL